MALGLTLTLILLILVVILLVVFFTGLALLIVGIVLKKRPKNKGRKSPVVMMIIGSVLMVPALVCTVWISVNLIRTDINRSYWDKNATSVVELWQNTNVTEDKAAEQAVKALLEAADKGDREAFAANFAKTVREEEGFDEKLDLFFKDYPGEMSSLRFKDSGVNRSGSSNRGVREEYGYTTYDAVTRDDSYYLKLDFCYENDKDPDKIGVTEFHVMNLGGYVDYHYDLNGYPIAHNEKSLLCVITSLGEVSARRIGGLPCRWKDTDLPLISKDEMKELLSSCKYLHEARASGLIGDANVEYRMSASTSADYIYEVKPENGENRYVRISVSSDDRIIDAHLSSDEKFAMETIVEFRKKTE